MSIYIIEYPHDELQAPCVWGAETPADAVRAIQCALELPPHTMSLQKALDANAETLSEQVVYMSTTQAQQAVSCPGAIRDVRALDTLKKLLQPVKSDLGIESITFEEEAERISSSMFELMKASGSEYQRLIGEHFKLCMKENGDLYSQILVELGWTPPQSEKLANATVSVGGTAEQAKEALHQLAHAAGLAAPINYTSAPQTKTSGLFVDIETVEALARIPIAMMRTVVPEQLAAEFLANVAILREQKS